MGPERHSPVVDLIEPLGSCLDGYERANPPSEQSHTGGVPSTFVDAMIVREEVFVKEQRVDLENELDDDDARCFHWVIYESPAHPAGTIRLVPPPNTLHLDFDKHRHMDGSSFNGSVQSRFYDWEEPFIKLGRLAIVQKHRGRGMADLLVSSALDYAATHAEKLLPSSARDGAMGQERAASWRGLVLIHAQKTVQKFWARLGFEVDKGMGIWDEEGIDHVAMWKRVSIE